MDRSTFETNTAELERVRAELRASGAADVLQRVQALHRMARLVDFNATSAIEHLSVLDDPGTALPLLSTSADAQTEWQKYADKAEILLHNYLLSAIALVEHARVHVRSAYPADSPTREQFDLGHEARLGNWDVHAVTWQLRNHAAHRALPPIYPVIRIDPKTGFVARAAVDRRPLLDNPRCRARARAILEALPADDLFLDIYVVEHSVLMLEFFDWFFRIQAMHDLPGLREADRLIRRHDALIEELRPAFE